ncbi:MAG: hypothetical protein ACOC56_06375 [Atribacterota bacterium]
MAKNKMGDVYDNMLGNKKKPEAKEKTKPKKDDDSFVRVNYFISKNQKRKLKDYTKKIAPAHIKISQSELIRYMIENFDLKKAKEKFFNIDNDE